MTEATQAQQTQITLGFEKALTMLDPNWRTSMTKDELNRHRHFYHQGIQDIYLLVRLQNEQLAQNFQSVLHTAISVGNEEELARLQAEQDAAFEAVADTPVKASKKAKKASLKAVPTPKKTKAKSRP